EQDRAARLGRPPMPDLGGDPGRLPGVGRRQQQEVATPVEGLLDRRAQPRVGGQTGVVPEDSQGAPLERRLGEALERRLKDRRQRSVSVPAVRDEDVVLVAYEASRRLILPRRSPSRCREAAAPLSRWR